MNGTLAIDKLSCDKQEPMICGPQAAPREPKPNFCPKKGEGGGGGRGGGKRRKKREVDDDFVVDAKFVKQAMDLDEETRARIGHR